MARVLLPLFVRALLRFRSRRGQRSRPCLLQRPARIVAIEYVFAVSSGHNRRRERSGRGPGMRAAGTGPRAVELALAGMCRIRANCNTRARRSRGQRRGCGRRGFLGSVFVMTSAVLCGLGLGRCARGRNRLIMRRGDKRGHCQCRTRVGFRLRSYMATEQNMLDKRSVRELKKVVKFYSI